MVVEPTHPFRGHQFLRQPGLPRPASVDHLDLVQPVHGLGQGVNVTVALGSHRRFDARLSQTPEATNGQVLRPLLSE